MKLLFLFFSAFLIISGCSAQKVESQKIENPQPAAASQSRQPVLVELFTSEGCSSCPPADRALAELDSRQPFAEAEIIALALHVDYWNYLGWKDEFSSPTYSRRQGLYTSKFKLDGNYTPQMVVDGEQHFVGSNTDEAKKAITKALKKEKSKIELSLGGDKLMVSIPNLPKHEDATVFLAIAESDLKRNVKRGENSGKTLEHVAVARGLQSLGMINAQTNEFKAETVVQIQPEWKKENLKFVVFVQENASRKILGVSQIKLSS